MSAATLPLTTTTQSSLDVGVPEGLQLAPALKSVWPMPRMKAIRELPIPALLGLSMTLGACEAI
jgi:hypothetical protein